MLARSLVLLVLAAFSLASHAQSYPVSYATSGVSVSEQYLVAAANQDRAARGLPPVQPDTLLAAAAMEHAREMARQGTISHQFPGEPDLASRASSAGLRFSLVSENVAEASNSALIHDLWMHSEGHRANLLDPHVNVVGIAVVRLNGQLYAVEDFARTVQRLGYADQEATVGSLLSVSGVHVSAGTAEARQTCQQPSGYAGSARPWFVMRWTSASLDEIPDELRARLATGKYREAAVGACAVRSRSSFTGFSFAVLLYP